MKKTYVTFLSLCLMMVALAANAAVRTWDFTKWSEATIANLKAEAALYGVDGDYPATTLWRSYEKADGSNPQTDKCYWYGTTIAEGVTANMTANGVEIEELKGLYFSPFNGGNLALAVDYPSTALGTYNGGAYLWLGGSTKNGNTMTIPAVKPGSTITMYVESHRNGSGRGVGLTVNGTAVAPTEGSETPDAITKCVWVVPTEGIETETVDAVFKNNNGCHIYSITVAEPAEPIFPINEDLTENTGKFINGEIITGKYVSGMVAAGGKGTASLVFDTDESTEAVEAYAIAENEVVTFKWTGYHGWISGGKEEGVSILNSDGKALFSYTYRGGDCFFTNATIGGETVVGFKAEGSSLQSGDGFNKKGKEYANDDAKNTVFTVSIYGKGFVDVNIVNGKLGKTYNYSATLPEGFKIDLLSLNLNNVCGNTDRAVGMNHLSIVSETATFMDYTVSRQCGDEVIGTYTATGMVGKDVVLPTSPFYTEDGQKYICLDAMGGVLAEDNKEFTIYYEKAAKYSWVLNAVDAEDNVLKKIKEGTAFQEDAVTVSYPRYVLRDSLLYEAAVNNKEYNQYITMDTDSKQVNVKYTAIADSIISRVVYYSEAEDMSNNYKKELTTGNATVRASQGKAVYTTYDASICTLPAGVYKLTVGLFDATRNLGDTLKFNNNRSEVATFITAAVNLSEQSKKIVLAAEKNSLSWVAGGTENWGLDYLFIEKVSDDVPYTPAANIAEAKTLNGIPVALTLTNAKVNLSTLHEDMYPSYTFIEDTTGVLALERQFASKLLEATGISLNESKQYTGTLYGTFGFDSNSRPVFYLTGKSLESTLEATDCEVVPVEVAVSDINTDEGMLANFGKYINLKNVEFGKVVGEWGGADYYLIATRTIANGDSATTEVKDSIMLYDNYYIFPENIPNFTSFKSINGFVDKFYDGTITFYPFGEYDAEVKPATRVANIGEVKNIEDGEDIVLTLDKAVVTLYTMGHSGNLVLLEDKEGGVQLQTGDGWFVQEGLADVIDVTRDSLQLDGTLYCRVENGGMLVLNDSTQAMSQVTVTGPVAVNPKVVALNEVLDNNNLNRLIQVQKVDFTLVETPDPYYPEYVMVEPYFVQGEDTVGVYDMFNALEYDENYNPVELGLLKSVTGIIIEGSEATSWSPATPNTLAPISYEELAIKVFTENEKVAMTEENVAAMLAEGWFEGGQTRVDNKKGNIDPVTGVALESSTAFPGVGLKKGNSVKTATVYVSGLESVKAFGVTTSGKEERVLIITATNLDTNEVIVGKASTLPNETGIAEVALDKEADYCIDFTGVQAADESAGGDVALHAIWFTVSNISTGITEVSGNSNAATFGNGELYNISGIKVRNAGESRNGLSKGIYLMKNGKKAVIK